jgi:acetyl-CoA synthetase
MSKKPATPVQPEDQSFPPDQSYTKNSHLKSFAEYEKIWQFAKDQPETFWDQQAKKYLSWTQAYEKVMSKKTWDTKWFDQGKLNASYNCIDRHLPLKRNKPAIYWEGEPGDTKILTYGELHERVHSFSNALLSLGLTAGDVVTLYMPMMPETIIAILSCCRIGVMHNVVFAGFSHEALRNRIEDCQSKVVITADGLWRKGKILHLKKIVDEALEGLSCVQHVVVYARTKKPTTMNPARDLWWHDIISNNNDKQDSVQSFDSEHPLFLLYTSGSTGKPKGILHTTAGYLLGAQLSTKYIFDLKDDDIFWCTADVGWITGHSYVIYGPLANGASIFIYEGAPSEPHWGRFWEMIERYKITKFYTAPTAIRSFMQQGDHLPQKYDLSSIKLLGTVGEPINPTAWFWYQQKIGKGKCPIVDTWWQTETGSIMISPLPGFTPSKPGSACLPFFGIVPKVVDEQGKEVPSGKSGRLVMKQPWPSMARTIHQDHQRYLEQYFNKINGVYDTGDSARKDSSGFFWILGRLDDVLNVSGHRLSTMEIESALVSHQSIVEAAVVGRFDEIKGEAISCFVILNQGDAPSKQLKLSIKQHVKTKIGALAIPDDLFFVAKLPKTRSGKIMRRLLRDIARGKKITGDLSTIEDISAISQFSSHLS